MTTGALSSLLEGLRGALEQGSVGPVLRASAERIRDDPAYAAVVRQELALLLSADATHVLTEVGILSDEGLFEGTLRRLGARVSPMPSDDSPSSGAPEGLFARGDDRLFDAIPADAATAWVLALLEADAPWIEPRALGSALVILATRIAGAGLHPRLVERMPDLEDWQSPFVALSRVADRYAECVVEGTATQAAGEAVLTLIDRCETQVAAFRARKQVLGTTLHLSSASLRMRQQLRRLALLVRSTAPDAGGRARAVAELAVRLLRARCVPRPVTRFIRQKLDLLSYLAVGHAAQKGERYGAHSAAAFWRFFYKAAKGGLLVAIFAILKLELTDQELAPLPQALVFGLNYAVCFVLIYWVGATLATKQPALTASRLAASLEGGPDCESFPYLVRAIWRSQFVSFAGNIVGAAGFALLIALGYAAVTGDPLVSPEDARALAAKNHPLESGSIVYACIAGVLLALSGLMAGFVDNAVIFHRLGARVRAGSGIFGWIAPQRRGRLARRLERELGDVSGNVVLGFLLAFAGMIGAITGLPIDIRHIAFSSSHSALAIFSAPELATLWTITGLFMAVLLIGLFNFLVSFGVTLYVAVGSRRVVETDWRARARALWRLAREAPLQFFVPIRPDPPSVRLKDGALEGQGRSVLDGDSSPRSGG